MGKVPGKKGLKKLRGPGVCPGFSSLGGVDLAAGPRLGAIWQGLLEALLLESQAFLPCRVDELIKDAGEGERAPGEAERQRPDYRFAGSSNPWSWLTQGGRPGPLYS